MSPTKHVPSTTTALEQVFALPGAALLHIEQNPTSSDHH